MSDEKPNEETLELILNLIISNTFDIETIDKSDPQIRSKYYRKLRELMEDNFSEIIDQIKFAGKEELDKLERDLISENNQYKLRILKIVRAIFYC